MSSINTYLEIGKKKIFASALDWPGWSRAGKTEDQALSNLFKYAPRYNKVLSINQFEFQIPNDMSDLKVVETVPGDSTTDFGAPSFITDVDREALGEMDLKRYQDLLQACWNAFDIAIENAEGKELRKGPRGGGRDQVKMTEHVLEAEKAYLRRLAWKFNIDRENNLEQELGYVHIECLNALEAAYLGELPEQGARGGKVWPPRYFVRRAAWHVLDHCWEIEDRIE